MTSEYKTLDIKGFCKLKEKELTLKGIYELPKLIGNSKNVIFLGFECDDMCPCFDCPFKISYECALYEKALTYNIL